MKKEDIFLVAEDGKKYLGFIRRNLLRAGLHNEILYFANGQEILNFLFDTDKNLKEQNNNKKYIILLDLNLPGVGGVEVLEKIKQDTKLKKIPVIIFTTADDPDIIERCHNLGCSTYIVRPTKYEDFAEIIQKIGSFLSVVEIPSIK